MEIEYKGGNCFEITNKKTVIVTDPKLSEIGLKDKGEGASVCLLTQDDFRSSVTNDAVIVNGPGEYEVQDCSILGIAAKKNTDDDGLNATIYRLELDGISIAILGHVSPKLSESQLENIGMVDVLIVPVGGYGYTLDAKSAVEIVKAVEPKIVVPSHYADEGINYPVPQASIDEFVKELGVTVEEISKLKIKGGILPEQLSVQVIKRGR